uniref:E3 ubiquitin-protein ligase TRIM21-like n=1 Tax=Pundamilia nyererei TaxID=303518 RepID=A0A3B4F5G8_9CICH
MLCIETYWKDAQVCRCPVCNHAFERRPDLKVNTFISELASNVLSLKAKDFDTWSAHSLQASPGAGVLCGICTDTPQEAIKSCVECQTSYCDVHLAPHHLAPGLKKHTLIEPVASLEGRICEEHNKLLMWFCRDDSALLCDVCSSSRHKEHSVVPVERAYDEKKNLLEHTEGKVQRMIQERLQNVVKVKESVKLSKTETEKVTASGQKTVEQEAGGVISESLKNSVSQLRTTLNKMNTDIQKLCDRSDVSNKATLRYMQQYEVNVLLDPDTAHPLLMISDDLKQVRYSMRSGWLANQISNPSMFTEHLAVLGNRSFSSRKFYFEVYVGQKTEWCLGMAAASVQRRGSLSRDLRSGLWPVHFGKVERIGVFVDYDRGQISFWDTEAATLIYSFTECFFTEELYPYFNPLLRIFSFCATLHADSSISP